MNLTPSKKTNIALLIFGIIIAFSIIVTSISSDDLDEICSSENSTLFKWRGEWRCLTFDGEYMIINYTTVNVSVYNNYTLDSDKLDGKHGNEYGNISGDGTTNQLCYFDGANSVKGIPDVIYSSGSIWMGKGLHLQSDPGLVNAPYFSVDSNGNLMLLNNDIYPTGNTFILGLEDNIPEVAQPLNLNVTGNIHSNRNISAQNYCNSTGTCKDLQDWDTNTPMNYTNVVMSNITTTQQINSINSSNITTSRLDIKGALSSSISTLDVDYLKIGNMTATPGIFTMNWNDTKWGMRVGIGSLPDDSQYGALLSVGYAGSGGMTSYGYGFSGTNGGGITLDTTNYLVKFYGGTWAYRWYVFSDRYEYLFEVNPNLNITFTNRSRMQFLGTANFYDNVTIKTNKTIAVCDTGKKI